MDIKKDQDGNLKIIIKIKKDQDGKLKLGDVMKKIIKNKKIKNGTYKPKSKKRLV